MLHLHGGGETASPLVEPGNVEQITANRGAIAWATPERQAEHPADSHTLFTTYTAGTVPVNAHFSWGPMYETEVVLDWMFTQRL